MAVSRCTCHMALVQLFFVMSVNFSRGYIPIGVEMLARLESISWLPGGRSSAPAQVWGTISCCYFLTSDGWDLYRLGCRISVPYTTKHVVTNNMINCSINLADRSQFKDSPCRGEILQSSGRKMKLYECN